MTFLHKIPDGLRTFGCTFLYWLVFLLALEPGNVLHAQNIGHALAFDREALRIGVASLLGSSTAPLIFALNHRYPLFGGPGWRSVAIHLAVAVALSFALILISCVLAAWLLMAKPLPSLPEIRGQLAANWLLLTLALSAFSVLSQALDQVRAPAPQPRKDSAHTIPVNTRGRLGYLEIARVEWIEAQGNYLALHADGRSHLVRDTLQAFSARLDQHRFVRVHRRAIVAVDRIREIQPLANGDSMLVLHDGRTIRSSRSYREAVRSRWAEAMARRAATQ
jgi:hypothetical protein